MQSFGINEDEYPVPNRKKKKMNPITATLDRRACAKLRTADGNRLECRALSRNVSNGWRRIHI
ncbi:hypothetical protein N9L68_05140 [bacterium]|nr:hypothetical protein [bacterium]